MENTSERRNPSAIDEVEAILQMLGCFYEAANLGTHQDLMNEFMKIQAAPGNQVLYFTDMLADTEREMRAGTGDSPAKKTGSDIQLMIVYAALANCAEAMQADLTVNQRWLWVCWAHHFLGRLRGSLSGELIGAMSAIAERARNASAGRHRENREFKKEVFAWLSENMHRFSSLDGAAEAIAASVVPVKFRTARDWAGAWKKEQNAIRSKLGAHTDC